MLFQKYCKGSFSCNQIVMHTTEPLINEFGTTDIISTIGLNIFYFKRKQITNKPKAYEWLSRRKNKQYNKNILKTFIRIHSHIIDIHY